MAFGALKRRSVVVAIGLILIALVIWFAGPYLAFAGVFPFESELVRVLIIVAMFAAWGVLVLFKRLRASAASARLMAGAAKPRAGEAPNEEARQLHERFDEAIAALQRGQTRGASLYDLPWYIFIGAPGSGKTTALVHSGLQFSLESPAGKGAVRGVGGTRNCDWWFTQEAVFLDTAGRYLTQDSDATADGAAWKEFLGLLRKHRKRRPINGVILAVSASDLLSLGPEAREQHVLAARRRLDELTSDLRIQLPVYVVVTKCDLVAGFTEYFDDLSADGRAQVWGVTFPYAQSAQGGAEAGVGVEVDALIYRLNERLFGRLNDESDQRRRTKIFGFPQQVAALRGVLADFVTDVFGASRFGQRVLLRGVYLTSGTQQGTPIDRLLSAISPGEQARDPLGASANRGKAYFIQRLLKDVVLGESGLAGVNRRMEWRQGLLQVGAYVGLAAIALLGVIALWISYSRNRAYIDDVGTAMSLLKQMPSSRSDASLEEVLPRLDAVRAAVDVADRYRDHVPLSMRWGLFQGRRLAAPARDAYQRELDETLVTFIRDRIALRLRSTQDPEELFEYLKAYRMLAHPERQDPAHLALVADLEWEAAGVSRAGADALSRHFKALLEDGRPLGFIPIDTDLVRQVKSSVSRFSIPKLILNRLREDGRGSADDLQLDVESGVGADQLLRFRNGRRLSDPVPRMFTAKGFAEVTTTGAAARLKQFNQDWWVLDQVAPPDSGETLAGVIDLYESEYITVWQDLLSNLDLAPVTGDRDVLARLVDRQSPLKGFLATVDKQTFLEKPKETPAAAANSPLSSLSTMVARGRALAGGTAVRAEPGARVTRHFKWLHDMVSGPGAGQIDSVLQGFGALRAELAAAGGAPLDPALKGRLNVLQGDAKGIPDPIGRLLAQAANALSGVVTGSLQNDFQSRYQNEVVSECAKKIDGRYPFDRNASVDVAIQDFGDVFGSGGVFDRFFGTYMRAAVDDATRPWRWRQDMALGSARLLQQFQQVAHLRQLFFRGGSTPQVGFTLTIQNLQNKATGLFLKIDGRAIEFRNNDRPVSLELPWPGSAPGPTEASFYGPTRQPGKSFPGAWWGLFRFLDSAAAVKTNGTRLSFSYQDGPYSADIDVVAHSVVNPFGDRAWQGFRCRAF